jgi:hypothetical protein
MFQGVKRLDVYRDFKSCSLQLTILCLSLWELIFYLLFVLFTHHVALYFTFRKLALTQVFTHREG